MSPVKFACVKIEITHKSFNFKTEPRNRERDMLYFFIYSPTI